MVEKSWRRKRQSKKEEGKYEVSEGNTCEFNTAAREAVACGARVLLGDRDFEVRFTCVSRALRPHEPKVFIPVLYL